MKKMLLLCFILLITAGCTTEVTLVIDEDKVSETIKIFDLKNEIYQNNLLSEETKKRIEVFEREYEFYDISEFEDQGYVGKTYELTENLELWAELSHLRPCYETFKLEKANTNLSLNTSEEYRCGYLFGANDVILTIESDLELISSNADKVSGNKLVWYINNDNYKNKSINFNYRINNSNDLIAGDNLELYLILLFAILIVVVVILVKKRNKESNKI